MGIMRIFNSRNSRKRRYKVPRGTAAELHRRLGLSENHIGLCIRGKREPGTELYEALIAAEKGEAAFKDYLGKAGWGGRGIVTGGKPAMGPADGSE